MKIRSVTCFTALSHPLQEDVVRAAGELGSAARELFTGAGLPVQTVRLATQPVNRIVRRPDQLLSFARELERVASAHGVEFKGLGAVEMASRTADLWLLDALPDVIGATENVFAAAQIATRSGGINLRAAHATARVIHRLAETTPGGIGNFRFAALANVQPNAPFFPAAFASPSPEVGLSFSIATEAADLAVRAVTDSYSLDDARERLILYIERAANSIHNVARTLSQRFECKFNGIDFTLAPAGELEQSLGTALERLTGNQFGERLTLFAAAFVTDCVRRARFGHIGFNGVFLPVLEDGAVAARSDANLYSIDSLLLYSSVCGTGLDTVPLPGDASEDELAAILLDLATLAVRLDKPLTARLMPVPDARVGDSTRFELAWLTNARVMETRGAMSREWAEANEWIGFSQD